ncbi:MAG: ABC transporter ATP-binding protein [Candidatus Promineifilaceae bacterium]
MSPICAIPVIEVKSLSKTYTRSNGKEITAVQNLDLSIEGGQVFGLLGPNGAGKTTIIKMICSLVRPSTGQIFLNGKDLFRQKHAALDQVGAVLEGARNVYWRLTAWQNLMYFGRLKGQTDQLKDRAEQLLCELDLWERRNDEVRLFSRGMQQKVALASALMSDPPILLLDEPTLGLDIQAARTIKKLIKQLAEEQGKTIILTTHQLDMAQEVCRRVAIISHGKLVANQPVQQLLSLFREEYYEIHLDGGLPATELRGSFAGLTIAQNGEGTALTGPMSNEQLYALLSRTQEMGLNLISANRIQPDLEEVFMKLVE